jgi:site-specific DNA recombinase
LQDDALKAQTFEPLRTLIEAAVLTPEGGHLTIDLRGELASMLSLCAGTKTQKDSAEVSEKALQIRLAAETGFDRCRSSFVSLTQQ